MTITTRNSQYQFLRWCACLFIYLLGFFLIWSLSFLPKEQQQQVYLISYDKIWVLFHIWLEMSFVSQTFLKERAEYGPLFIMQHIKELMN